VSAAAEVTEEEAYVSFAQNLAEGECVCAEIHPSDRPCLTCDAKRFLRDLAVELAR
jgi:hypothetical protein